MLYFPSSPKCQTALRRLLTALLTALLLSVQPAFLFAQTTVKPRGNSPAEAELKLELQKLRQTVLQKIEKDLDRTATAFSESESIFRSLRVAYSFKTVLDRIDDAFALFGLPRDVMDVLQAKTKTELAVNAGLAAGSVLLIIDSMKEDAGKLELVFNSKRYVENVRQILKEAGATQPIIGFDKTVYAEGIKFQLGTSRGQEVVSVIQRPAKNVCRENSAVAGKPQNPVVFKGAFEVRRHISGLFQQLDKEIDSRLIADHHAAALVQQIKRLRTAMLESNLKKTAATISAPAVFPNCAPNQTEITLGRVAQKDTVLALAYEALNYDIKIERRETVRTAAGAMLGATQFYFDYGSGKMPSKSTREVVEAFDKVLLSIELGDWVAGNNRKIGADELIGSLPQEMLLSMPFEFSEVVLAVDTLAGVVRKSFAAGSASTEKPVNLPLPVVPSIPTLFLFDVSGSMAENNKLESARAAGLRTILELKENRRLGRDNSPVSIWVFSGDCQPSTARQILPFTTNLAQAENVIGRQLPKPDGGTPLPQAIDRSVAQMTDYLNANPNISSGRIIVLSDGQSTCSEIRPAGVYSQAKSITYRKIVFLTIGYDIAPGSQAERDLQYLASTSGGRYFPANNGQQLSRAFEKSVRVYVPKPSASANPDFERGVRAILDRDFSAALRIWTIYVQANPADARGFYNLALVCEAAELYKMAAENYRQYLSLLPSADDAAEVSGRIGRAEDDYRAKLYYYADLLRSDLAYMKDYYQRLFGVRNRELAAEFAGFVDEKRGFYANLPAILELKISWLRRGSDELTDSLGGLSSRVNLPSFDRDAVSLLPLSISQLEELIERLDDHNARNFTGNTNKRL